MGFEQLGAKLLGDRGHRQIDSTLLEKVEVVALYFSGSWCGPCKVFTPKLVSMYQSVNSVGKQFEVVYVSADQSEEDFKDSYDQMPWLSVQYDEDLLETLSSVFEVNALPSLCIMKKDGTVKRREARPDLDKCQGNYNSCFELWKG